jgi:hypothetical protein
MQLLVTMEQRQSRMVGDEIEFDFLETAEHHDVFDDAGRVFAADAHELETVPVQMQRMNVVAGVPEFEPVPTPFVQGVHGLHPVHRESFAIEQPLIETVQRAVVLDDPCASPSSAGR